MTTLIKNAILVNEGKCFEADVFIQNGLIDTIGKNLTLIADTTIHAGGRYLLPGVIDDQVHFREPGLTHKAEIRTESMAAVAGGVTSFMEMPNTLPPTLTQALLEEKYNRAASVSVSNFSFFMGASNDNLEDVLKTNPKNVCGVKVFMGSSTGNMLVDNESVLEALFKNSPSLIAVHCEDEATVKANLAHFSSLYGEAVNIEHHPLIRSEEACYLSSSKAVALARKTGARLHVLHISTAKELSLFNNALPLSEKKITAEACVHHLWFTDKDYLNKGNLIKWNPAVKTIEDRTAIRKAVNDNRIDIVATDHAPHTREEKAQSYLNAPSGAPLLQHSLVTMLEMYHQGIFTLEKVVEKMCHHPAICFRIEKRGFIREGYYADLVLVDLHSAWEESGQHLYYKCKWSPLEGTLFKSRVTDTWVNGNHVFHNGEVNEFIRGMRLTFK